MDVETKAKDLQTLETPTQISHRTENVNINPLIDTSLSDEKSWDFKQILGMKRHVGTFDVTPALSAGTSIYSFRNTPFNVLTLFNATNLSSYFSFFRYNLVFNIEVQSAMQHVGALIVNQTNCTVRPTANNTRTTSVMPWIGLPNVFPTDIISKTILPHDFITLGHNGFYSITMPWNSSRKVLPTSGNFTGSLLPFSDNAALFNYDLGFLDISIFSPLVVQAAVYSTTSIRILASLEDIEYSGYRPSYTI